jgi:hypothetical protein
MRGKKPTGRKGTRDSLHHAARYGPSCLNLYSIQEFTGNILDAANKEATEAWEPYRTVYPGLVLQLAGLFEASDLDSPDFLLSSHIEQIP